MGNPENRTTNLGKTVISDSKPWGKPELLIANLGNFRNPKFRTANLGKTEFRTANLRKT